MRAILFDLDGTLADTRQLYAEAYLGAFVDVLGEAPTWEDFLRLRPSSERYFLLEHYGEETGGRLHERMLEIYAARAAELHGALYEGVEELVAWVRGEGLATAIVTGKSRRGLEVSRRHVDLSAFEVVVVEEDVPVAKPDPAGIHLALERLGADPAEALYLGDTPMDVEAARRARVQPAAALWARSPEDRARLAAGLDDDVWPLEHPRDLLQRLLDGRR